MSERDDLNRLRKLRELEAKASGKSNPIATSTINEGGAYNKMILQSEKDAEAYGGKDPSAIKKFALGAKHSAIRSYSGVKDFVSELSPEDKQRLQQGEAFVNQHGGYATAGQIAGDVLPDIALGVGTGGASLPLRMAMQGASSFLRTPGDIGDRSLAGAFALGGEGVGDVIGRGIRGAGKIVEPYTSKGRERIVNRTLNGAYTGEGDLMSQLLRGNTEIIQGVKPTTAQAAQDAGISRLSDSLSASNANVGSAIKNSDLARNTAYQSMMQNIAGTPEELARAKAIRSTQGQADFGRANSATLNSNPELDATAERLLQSPYVQQSVPGALEIAKGKFALDPANNGMKFTAPPDGSVGGISHIAKDLSNRVGKAMNPNSSADPIVLADTRDAVVNYLRSASPLYAEATDNYAKNSRPINQMQIGKTMYEKAFPAVVDESGLAFRMNKNSFLNAKRGIDDVAQNVTKLRNKSADEILEPWQRQAYDNIGADLGRAESAQAVGQGVNSATAARLSDAKALNPTGILSKALRTAAYLKAGMVGGQVADMAINATSKKFNGKIGDRLGDAIIDPNTAIDILRNTNMKPGRFMRSTDKNLGIFSGLGDTSYHQNYPYRQTNQEQ